MGPDATNTLSNRLAQESSPYLRQHAHNPVDWYPWGEEALIAARREDKPILLSIGYSACHWCHVMAHESFEHAPTADLMNREFINIKVDREERPDLDRIYQLAQQMITQHGGGWPLTMFLTPDEQVPFFGGTYFPREARHGMPAFREVLTRVARYFREHRTDIARQKQALQDAYASLAPPPAAGDQALDDAPLQALREALARSFDAQWGGFGHAPKFPQAPPVEAALRIWARSRAGSAPDLQALYMATLTLARMGEGGICDQLGGGFFRYSTDEHWSIPHFEKMLYDNAALLALYAQVTAATSDPVFAGIAAHTAQFLLRDLQDARAGFCAALDADSAGGEGAYYVFGREELRAQLSPADYAPFAQRYGLDRTPNFEEQWHLRICESLQAVAQRNHESDEAMRERLRNACAQLLRLRSGRTPPARDGKILTAWNGLAIRALALASRVLDRPELAQAADNALDRVKQFAWRDGRLLACIAGGRGYQPAFLDDHAFLAQGLLELLQCRWRSADLVFLRELLDALLAHFEDPRDHGFFFTADDHEQLLYRSKSFADDLLPNGNAVAAMVLYRAGSLLAEPRYLAAAERTLRAGYAAMREAPQAHASLILALTDVLDRGNIVIVRGEPRACAEWTRQLAQLYAPSHTFLAIPRDAEGLPEPLAVKAVRGEVCAYRCEAQACAEPVSDLGALIRALP